MRKFTGLLIEDGEVKRESKFTCFGEMCDGSKCYHELDNNDEEIEDTWYSMARRKINGVNYTLFFLEGK